MDFVVKNGDKLRMLLYVGMKIKVKNENIIYGSLLKTYKKLGYLYISEILDNGNILISNTIKCGVSMSINEDSIEPIYDDNILSVLREKKKTRSRLDIEIHNIENFINERCKI